MRSYRENGTCEDDLHSCTGYRTLGLYVLHVSGVGFLQAQMHGTLLSLKVREGLVKFRALWMQVSGFLIQCSIFASLAGEGQE